MKQIIALGGGGFSMEPDNPLLDLYILEQTGKPEPKICFLGTASGDAENYIEKFYHFFQKQKCKPSHLSLFKPSTRKIEDFIMDQDIIYVGGGNTKNLLVLWKEWGLDCILKKAWENGTILAGISAGSLCWFEEGLTDSYGDELEQITCLGFVNGSNCVHYDEGEEKRTAFHSAITNRVLQNGIAADNGVAIHFVDGQVKKAVSSRPNAKAYRVMLTEKGVDEEELTIEYLGNTGGES